MSFPLALLWVAVGAAPLKVAAPDWRLTGVDRGQAQAFQERFFTLLTAKTGLEVITERDLEAVLGLERQRQLMGCSDEGASECLAEVSSALGADVVLSGSLTKTERFFVVTLRGVNAVTGKAFASATARLADEDALFNWLEAEAANFAERMRESFEAWVEARSTLHYQYRRWPWIPLAGGVALAGLGVALFGASRVDLAAVRAGLPSEGDPLISSGQVKQDLGVGLAIAGVVAVAAGVGLLLWTREAQSSVVLTPMAGGGALVVSGAW